MIKVVSNEQMRDLDKQTIEDLGVPGIVLMENAGYQTFLVIKDICVGKRIHQVFVLCGKGNNGGDGFVIARHLFKAGFGVKIFTVATEDDLNGDALINFKICQNYRIQIEKIQSADDLPHLPENSMIVDALLGTGIKGAVSGLYESIIEWVNAQEVTIAAVDIPSGLNGNSTDVSGSAVKADLTVTMALPKYAHLFYPARSFTGELHIADIGLPEFLQSSDDIRVNLIEKKDIILPEATAWQNKYTAGKVFMLAGSAGMTGAAVMSAMAAQVTGAGLIIVGIANSLNPILENKLTEPLTLPLPEDEQGILSQNALPLIYEKMDWADAILIGPGMGRHPKTMKLIAQVIEYGITQNKNLVIDADALYLLSEKKDILTRLNANHILTPHYGEFLRLSGDSTSSLRAEPWEGLRRFNNKYHCTVNLKGAPSVVGHKDEGLFINSTGNQGLAKGGSGDVLAGLTAGFLARKVEPLNAAIYANYILGMAGDTAKYEMGMTSYTPVDLIGYIKISLNSL
ncbi:MAG: NAD(P)H-hydrate dehydratase [Calditrichaceae bacterium]